MAYKDQAMDADTQNLLAARLTVLHKPGDPVFLANVFDGHTAKIVSSKSNAKAVATASYAIAATHGINDDDMTLQQNLQSIKVIASVVIPSGKPLTVDLQDGYEDVTESVRSIIRLGAVGCNLEDANCKSKPSTTLRDIEDAVSRVRQVRAAAAEMGVPDFALNARTDALIYGGTIEDAISRGTKYLEAGATTVFVWGGSKRGVSKDEVKQLVKGLGGMVNVKMNLRPGFLNAKELQELGVARVSVGPELFHKAMAGFEAGIESVLGY